MNEPVFVLSILLSDLSEPCRIVLGVRRSSQQSNRHPGVLSTPTQRVPRVLFEACQASWPLPGEGELEILGERETSCIGGPNTSADPLSYAIEGLLCRKLGLTDALAEGRTHGVADVMAVSAAVVEDQRATQVREATVMLTVRVLLTNLLGEMPSSTGFFDPIVTAEVGEFVCAVETNDALVADPSLDPFEVCIGGLCVSTGAVLFGAQPNERDEMIRSVSTPRPS